jgi:hypothetical protein
MVAVSVPVPLPLPGWPEHRTLNTQPATLNVEPARSTGQAPVRAAGGRASPTARLWPKNLASVLPPAVTPNPQTEDRRVPGRNCQAKAGLAGRCRFGPLSKPACPSRNWDLQGLPGPSGVVVHRCRLAKTGIGTQHEHEDERGLTVNPNRPVRVNSCVSWARTWRRNSNLCPRPLSTPLVGLLVGIERDKENGLRGRIKAKSARVSPRRGRLEGGCPQPPVPSFDQGSKSRRLPGRTVES